MKKYTESHEWVEKDGDKVKVGISNHAQSELGDIVYVELPEIGKKVKKGDELVVLESTKAAADVYSPVSGEIVDLNGRLNDEPDLINRLSETEGWLVKLKPSSESEMEGLMSADKYKEFLG